MNTRNGIARAVGQALLCAAVAAVLVQPSEAPAQFGGGGMRGGGMGGGGMGGGMRESKGGRDRQADAAPVVRRHLPDEVDERLYLFEEDLHLTRDQQPSWQRYANAVRAGAKDVERDRVRGELREKVPVLQRVERLVEASRNRLTALEDIAAASKALYGSLSPAQQDISDPRLASIASLLVDSGSRLPSTPPGK